jgi:hypothetical protein
MRNFQKEIFMVFNNSIPRNMLFLPLAGIATLFAACAVADEPPVEPQVKSTDQQIESTDQQIESADQQVESTDQQVESADLESDQSSNNVSVSRLSFTDNGITLTASGTVSGLPSKHDAVVVKLIAMGKAKGTCTNPGGHQPPGQNPVFFPITLAGSVTIPAHEIKYHKVSFKVTTDAPKSPVPGAPQCPNPNWIEKITDVAFTSAKIIVFQPQNKTVLTISCTFSPPTYDGVVSGSCY